ncbi:ATP-binding protein, partial [Patescibacteria group bacterium]
QTVLDNGESLLTIINDILDLSKVESGRLELLIEDFDSEKLIYNVISLLEPSAKEKGISLEHFIEDGVPERLNGPFDRIVQILRNLVGNAIKFTEKHGSVQISMSLCNERDMFTRDPKIGLLFKVKDTGIGIDKENLPRILEPFTQADSGISKRYGGTGLGLAISKNLISLMGGKLMVESEPGKGSTFSFTISFDEAKESESQREIEQNEIDIPNLKILLAEDNNVNQMLFNRRAIEMGHRVTIADDGIEAIAAVLRARDMKQPFDVIFMDVQMPNMDGMTATRKLRTSGCNVPIIALTANAMKGDKERCINTGMDEYLSKPFTPEGIKRKLNILLRSGRIRKDPGGKDQDVLVDLREVGDSQIPVSPQQDGQIEKEVDNFFEILDDKSLVRAFIEDAEGALQDMSVAITDWNIVTIRRLAHKIKGTSGYGLDTLYEISMKLEDQAREIISDALGIKYEDMIEQEEILETETEVLYTPEQMQDLTVSLKEFQRILKEIIEEINRRRGISTK